ncbi:MAG: WXG100 family type VII secretion target, partial [Clostridiales bacterium]|nr:WXG100 family type VII secretion target [Clostridiales bacterium]
NEIKNGIRNMSNNWKGSSAESFYNQFNQLSPSFDAYKLVLNEYGDFLTASAGTFEATEAKIGSDSGTLKSTLYNGGGASSGGSLNVGNSGLRTDLFK